MPRTRTKKSTLVEGAHSSLAKGGGSGDRCGKGAEEDGKQFLDVTVKKTESVSFLFSVSTRSDSRYLNCVVIGRQCFQVALLKLREYSLMALLQLRMPSDGAPKVERMLSDGSPEVG